MKKIISCGMLFLSVQLLLAQNASFDWAKRIGGTTADKGNAIVSDASGNVYTIGSFEGAIDFNPGPGAAVLISNGNADVFVEKLDASGNFAWVKRIGGTGADYGNSIAIDGNGDLYIIGSVIGTVDMDPGTAVLNYTSAGEDVFIEKLDAAGNLIWVKEIGGSGYEYASKIKTDAANNIYFSGQINSVTDFDPGAGAALLTPVLSTDGFFAKWDAAGNYMWAKQLSVDQSYLRAPFMDVDAAGNVYATGNFRNSVDLDPGAGMSNFTSNGMEDYYALKLDASGTLLWAHTFGGTSIDFGNSIAADGSGNAYITGTFSGSIDFDPGAATNDLIGGLADVFIQKLDAAGDYVWAKQITGTGYNDVGYITIDATGNPLLTGAYDGTSDFDPDPSTDHYLTVSGFKDIYIEKLDAMGNFSWVKTVNGTSNAIGLGLYGDASGNIYATGYFSATGDFDPGADSAEITAVGSQDAFILKLKACTPYNLTASRTLCTGENYVFGSQTLNTVGTYTETFISTAGCDSMVTLTITAIVPLPVVTANVSQQNVCPNQAVVFTGSGASSYVWSGGVTNGVPHNVGATTTYTVTGTDASACSNTASVTVIAVQAPVQQVCVVTVDSALANHTVIVWEKPSDLGGIDSFYLYREITLNNYQRIAAIHKDSLSECHDMTANPNSTNYKYKLSTLDTCGNEGVKGLFHNTIHLQYFGLGNFQWTNYLIENTANPVASYNFYRDDNSTGVFNLLQVLPGNNNSFTDVNYASFPNASYRVDVSWQSSMICTPTRGAINTSRSNIKSPSSTIGLQTALNDRSVKIYPQPANDRLYIETDKQFKTLGVELTDALGHQLIKQEYANSGSTDLDISAIAAGVYTLKVKFEGGSILKKIVVTK
jgi:hypothetical protein